MTAVLDAPPTGPVAGPQPAPSEPVDAMRTPLAAALAAFSAWAVLLSWRGLTELPGDLVSRPLAVAAVLVAVVGWAARRWTGHGWTALPAQLVVLLVWLMERASGSFVPTLGHARDLVREIGDGVLASQCYYSPVSADHPEFGFLLVLGGVGVIWAVDILACGLRQPALAGLPLLLGVTVSASILIAPIPVAVVVVSAVGWLGLLLLREVGRPGSWVGEQISDLGRVLPVALAVALVTLLVAAIATDGLGTQGRLFQTAGTEGQGPGESFDIDNPLLDMRRNLRSPSDTPLVEVQAPSGSSPSYVRTAVLDLFNGQSWTPSSRGFSETEPVQGDLPFPVGLDRDAAGKESTWQMHVLPLLRSRWLPIPTPATYVGVGSNWRYDPVTLDVSSNVTTASGLRYRVRTFEPQVDPARLRTASRAPDEIRAAGTQLPSGLPPVFTQVARRVTADADNDWDRAVALQRWFRETGDFTYSTDPAPGNGIATLTRFITTDRVGYCEQFATAMATMARALGIPARVSTGFLSPSQTSDGADVFSAQDLHAWPELYFEGAGWVRFEPTPSARTGAAPDYTQPRDPTDDASTSPSAEPSSQAPSPSASPSTSSRENGGTGAGIPWRWVLPVLLVLLVGTLGALPVWLRRRRLELRWARARDPRPLADAAWAEVSETARGLDLGWSDTASVRVNARHAEAAVTTPEARRALADVARFVELTRYSGTPGPYTGSGADAPGAPDGASGSSGSSDGTSDGAASARGGGVATLDRATSSGADVAADRSALRADVRRWRLAAFAHADRDASAPVRWWRTLRRALR